jgi:hypothetical protein
VLALEVLRTVLADDLDAGFHQHRHVRDRDVLRRRDDRDVVADVGTNARVVGADDLR